MNDTITPLLQLKEKVARFVSDREWNQFHNPKNLSMDIAVEAAELMELFLWVDNAASFEVAEKRRQEMEDELADIVIGVICFANATKIDVAAAFAKKLASIEEKYPIEQVKGRSDKYTAYHENRAHLYEK